jgi:caa(3)-type oxidase subunit IV
MSDTPDTAHADPHAHGPNVSSYLMVFGALVVFTLASFVANYAARADVISHMTSFGIILAVAFAKAALVAMIFMHLKYDWGKVYIMIVPALVLGPMLVVVLLPDIVLAWRTTVAGGP